MRLLLLAILTTLLLAAPASAARFAHSGSDIAFTTGSADNVRVIATDGDPELLTFTRGAGGTAFTVGTGCTLSVGIARCTVPDGAELRFTTNERADLVNASAGEVSVPQRFDTRGGDDVLSAGPLADVVSAGAGNDTISGGAGGDELRGDAGDDTFTGLTAGDLVDGGDGADVLDLSAEPAGLEVSLNGAADDGPGAANVLAVETVLGTPSGDSLIGGPDADRLEGGGGNDTIQARGGGADVVDCGAGGADVATVDESDLVTGCERIDLPAPDEGGGAADDADDAPVVRPPVTEAPAEADPPAPALVAGRLSFEFSAFPNGTTKVDKLLVRGLQRGARVELRCKGCGFRRKVGRPNRDRAVNLRRLVRRRLRTGAVLEVRLTAPGAIGRVIRFRMRDGKLPKRTNLRLPPNPRPGV
jgi:hypothetical protein